MKLWRPRLIFLLCVIFLLVTCMDDCESSTAPDISTTTTVESDEPTRPPRVDVAVDLWSVRGCTTFGAAALTEPELVSLIYHVQARGCDIMRTGAQTDEWKNHPAIYLAASAGPSVFSPEWKANLERFLDVTARMGIAVQLVPTFTHKHERFERNMKITKAVVAIQQAGSTDDPRPFEHIVWEAWNEVQHPVTSSSNKNMANIKKMLTYLRNETGLPVGTDSSGGHGRGWEGEYPRELLPFVSYVAFHPPRNNMDDGGCESIRPNYWQLRKAVNSYSKPVWFDEPTAYVSDESKALYGIERDGHYALCAGGSEGARKTHIGDYMWDVEAAGGIWFSHNAWGFECRRPGWLPQ